MLEAIRSHAPSIYQLVHTAYSAPSVLRWGNRTISSAEGVQQGDPLGPLLFCLTLHSHCLQLKSMLNIMYLDDISLGGSCEDILHDLDVIKDAEKLGLFLNNSKSEIICHDHSIRGTIITQIPGAKVVDPAHATLLGSPLGGVESISAALDDKIEALVRMGERLEYLTSHDALVLLRNSFAIPKLQYLLRSAPCFKSPSLQVYDNSLRSILCAVINVTLGPHDPAWHQATLPVRLGWLGIQSAVKVTPSAFLASSNATAVLVNDILPADTSPVTSTLLEEALTVWLSGHNSQSPEGAGAMRQKSWDEAGYGVLTSQLLEEVRDGACRARLLASASKKSGAWLHALPVTSLGLRLDEDSVRIAVGLRLGVPVCGPHSCHHCGADVDAMGRHGLSCRMSEGRHQRHGAVNEIIQRMLTSYTHVPSRREPLGLRRSDGKRPDGVTTVPWKCGKLLAWMPRALTPLLPPMTARRPQQLVRWQPTQRRGKYSNTEVFLSPTHSSRWQLRLLA